MFVRKVILLGVVSVGLGALVASPATANDWLLAPSFYSHDPETGQRAVQYTQPQPAYVQENPSYLKSGYHHRRSTIRGFDGSLDQLHIVEEWGRPVRPYGEWERPYRPYSVPYQLWGQPYGGLGPVFQNNFGGPINPNLPPGRNGPGGYGRLGAPQGPVY
ncbi:hypothetical protein AB1L30_14605 [Bremerella sp. JC817]